VRTGAQGSQVDVQPKPVEQERMAIDLTNPAQGRVVGLTPLGKLGRTTGIEDASNGGLLDELVATPSLSEQAVGANGGIDLRNHFAAGQQSDEEIE
jgi:hypothetical protein